MVPSAGERTTHTDITLIDFRATTEIKASSCLITQRNWRTEKHQHVIRSLFLFFFIGMLYLNNVTTSQNSAVAVSRQTQTPTI